MEPITIRFTPTAGDYARVTWHLTLKQTKRPVIVIGIVSMVIFAALFALFMVSGGVNDIQKTGALFFGLFVVLTIAPFVLLSMVGTLLSMPLQAYWTARRSPNLREEITYTFTNERFVYKDAHNELIQDWANFAEVLSIKSYYILTFALNKRLGRFVPRRAIVSPEQEAALIGLLKSKLKFEG